jgi:hypothetical protein
MSDLVRLGRNADGGYLLPRPVLGEINGCLSFGLGAEWSFEQALLELKKENISPKNIVFFDASISVFGIIKSLIYMGRRSIYEIRSRRPKSERKFTLEDLKRSLIALVTYLPTFRIRKNRFTHIRKFVVHKVTRGNEISFIDALSYRSDPMRTIVKIDIEGGEWDLLRGKEDVDLLADVPVLIMEIHGTIREEFGVLVELIKSHFWIAHLHGNTSDRCTELGMPHFLEMTFVNKRYSPEPGFRKRLPIDGLDFPMRPGEEPYEFVFNNV